MNIANDNPINAIATAATAGSGAQVAPAAPALAGLGRTLRRAVAIAALCVSATAGTMWMTDSAASAGPRDDGHLSAPALSAAGSGAPAVRMDGRDSARRTADKGGGKRVAQKGGGSKTAPLVVRGKELRGVLNLNTATEDQLRLLPGIGASKAARIAADRKKRGKYQRVRDLRRVKGVGYKTLKKLSPYLTVQGPTTLRLE
ncbi:MAG: helix-hairpin-helix domain-containing protein [Myxococcota bacterium]